MNECLLILPILSPLPSVNEQTVCVCVCVVFMKHQEIPSQAFQLISTPVSHVTGDTQPRLCASLLVEDDKRNLVKREREREGWEGEDNLICMT